MLALVVFIGVCFAEKSRETESPKRIIRPSQRQGILRPVEVGTKPVKKIEAVKKKPVLVAPPRVSLQKEVATLRGKISELEAKVTRLEDRPATVPGSAVGFRKTKDNKYVLSVNGARIEIDKGGSITIRAGANMTLQSNINATLKSGMNTTIQSGANMTVSSGMNTTIRSSANMDIKSALLKLNGGSQPLVRLSDTVVCPRYGGKGTILGGCPTVLVP